MSKKVVSAFAYNWYPVYELRFGVDECAFEVDVRVLKRWGETFKAFEKVQAEIKAAQATMKDMR